MSKMFFLGNDIMFKVVKIKSFFETWWNYENLWNYQMRDTSCTSGLVLLAHRCWHYFHSTQKKTNEFDTQ
jgi:hypothetical protein